MTNTAITQIVKKAGVNYDAASLKKIDAVNKMIADWNETGYKVTWEDEVVRDILVNSYFGCVDCGISDCISYEFNGTTYEDALVELRDAIIYEVDRCMANGIDARETKVHFIEKGWALA